MWGCFSGDISFHSNGILGVDFKIPSHFLNVENKIESKFEFRRKKN